MNDDTVSLSLAQVSVIVSQVLFFSFSGKAEMEIYSSHEFDVL